MLLDLFEQRKVFKLVCGAGNEDATEVEKLVFLYSKAGCNFFDLCAKPEIVDAAKKGLERAGIKENRYICVSVGISGDPHVSKAHIDTKRCIKCGASSAICPQNAICFENNEFYVNKSRCIGCGKCFDVCPQNCIERINCAKDLKEILPEIIAKGIDCIELHVVGTDEKEVDTKWKDLNDLYDGPLSISIDRSKLGDDLLFARVKRMLKTRKPFSTIIQADGIAMSGGVNDYRSTLQAVAIADLFQSVDLPVYLMISGGTNAKTAQLAKMCNIKLNAIAIGSYARKIVREYIDRDDFFENKEVFNSALKIAKELVDVSLKDMQ
ncbi:4Fe-4S binding protein [bacterium]|nr:4Fe-4S binding protein [bacterium]